MPSVVPIQAPRASQQSERNESGMGWEAMWGAFPCGDPDLADTPPRGMSIGTVSSGGDRSVGFLIVCGGGLSVAVVVVAAPWGSMCPIKGQHLKSKRQTFSNRRIKCNGNEGDTVSKRVHLWSAN